MDDGAAITMSAASPLSAAAHPFFPGETSMGRSMQLRWLDSGDEEMVDYSFTPSPQPASYRDAVLRSPSSSEPLRPRQRLGRPGCGRLLWVLLSPPTPPLIATGDAPPGVCATGEPLSFGLRFFRPAQPCLSLRRIATIHWLMLTASRRSSPALPGDACVATVAAAVATATGRVASHLSWPTDA